MDQNILWMDRVAEMEHHQQDEDEEDNKEDGGNTSTTSKSTNATISSAIVRKVTYQTRRLCRM